VGEKIREHFTKVKNKEEVDIKFRRKTKLYLLGESQKNIASIIQVKPAISSPLPCTSVSKTSRFNQTTNTFKSIFSSRFNVTSVLERQVQVEDPPAPKAVVPIMPIKLKSRREGGYQVKSISPFGQKTLKEEQEKHQRAVEKHSQNLNKWETTSHFLEMARFKAAKKDIRRIKRLNIDPNFKQ
jgi:hypothetical protein